MADIAHCLGVAPSTVSRALRDDPRIGASTRARVREAVKEMDYRPNPLVSALMATRRRGGAGQASIIALITHYGGREDWRRKDVCRWEFDGIRERAAALGFRVEVFALSDYGNAARLEKTLRARGIRGVLLGFSREDSAGALFDCTGFCAAGLSAYFQRVPADRANFHGFFNVQLALDEMARLGYERPALVVPDLNNRVSNNQWSGAYLDWQRGIPRRRRCEPFIPREDGMGAAEFSDWLYRNEPDSLLVYKLPVRAWLASRGLRVPEDMGLAFLYRTAQEMGSAAGIDGNLDRVGAAALDLVVERLNANSTGAGEHPKEVLIKGTWHDGPTLPPREASSAKRSFLPCQA